MVTQSSGERSRLATFSSRMTFGEMAMIDRAPRSAMIVADTDAECELLTSEDFDRLALAHPQIKINQKKNPPKTSGLTRNAPPG